MSVRAESAPLTVVMAAPDPRDPGGITAVVESWKRAGLADRVTLVELPTSARESAPAVKLAQAARAALRLIPRLAGNRKADVVHLHASTGGSLWRKLVLSWCCRIGRVPYVVQEHSGELERWIGSSRVRLRAARSLYGHAAAAIVLAERWVPTLKRLGASQVEVLPNGLSRSERVSLGAAEEIRMEGAEIEAGVPATLLFYARWVPKKGPDRLAAALRSLNRSDYRVHVYGSGDRDAMIKTFRGVGGEVTIGGWLKGEQKMEELGRAAALIAPSRAEGLPVALLEARAAGTPVIATDVGAVAEVLRSYPAGLLLESGDAEALSGAIERLLEGDWPGDSFPAPFPPALESETSVDHLVGLYAAVARSRSR